jgi:hypothetical protein
MRLSLVLAAFLVMPCVAAPARAVTVKGRDYGATVSVEGRTLKLVGAGLRKKWGFPVYAMGVYTESGACDPALVVDQDEVKYLKLDFLRDVTAEKMSSTIGESFDKHLAGGASEELKNQKALFLNSLKDDLNEGTVLEFVYVPGKGTTVRQNGRQIGTTYSGKGFAHVLWDIYFGPRTCCEGLKDDVFSSCGK